MEDDEDVGRGGALEGGVAGRGRKHSSWWRGLFSRRDGGIPTTDIFNGGEKFGDKLPAQKLTETIFMKNLTINYKNILVDWKYSVTLHSTHL